METSLNSPAEHLRLAKHQRADRSAFRLEPLVDMPSRRVVHDSGARPAELLLFAPRRRSEVANRIINSSIAAEHDVIRDSPLDRVLLLQIERCYDFISAV